MLQQVGLCNGDPHSKTLIIVLRRGSDPLY